MSSYERNLVRVSLVPAARTDGTVNGSAVDTGVAGGCGSLVAFVITGALTDGVHTLSVDESATGTGDWSAVAEGGIAGTAPVTDAAVNDNTTMEWGITPSKRYVRITCVTSGSTSGGLIGGGFLLVDNRFGPAR